MTGPSSERDALVRAAYRLGYEDRAKERDYDPGHALDLLKDAHHPNCYQITGTPDDLPDDLCDCRVLRAIDAFTVEWMPRSPCLICLRDECEGGCL